MDHIDYFKRQAKNLLKDYKTRFLSKEDDSYKYQPRFFNISDIFFDFGYPHEKDDFNFTLMQAQHIVSKLAGYHSFSELSKANNQKLEIAHRQFDESDYKLDDSCLVKSNKKTLLPAPKNLYAWITPNGVFGISVEFSFDSVEYSKKYLIYSSNTNDITVAQPLAEGEFSPIKYKYLNNRSPHKFFWVRAFDGSEYGEWSEIAARNRN